MTAYTYAGLREKNAFKDSADQLSIIIIRFTILHSMHAALSQTQLHASFLYLP